MITTASLSHLQALQQRGTEGWIARSWEHRLWGSQRMPWGRRDLMSPSRQLCSGFACNGEIPATDLSQFCRHQWAARSREPSPTLDLTHKTMAGSKRHKPLFLGDLKQNRAGASVGLNKPRPKEGCNTPQTQKRLTVLCYEQPFILENAFLISLFFWLSLMMTPVVFFTVHREGRQKIANFSLFSIESLHNLGVNL